MCRTDKEPDGPRTCATDSRESFTTSNAALASAQQSLEQVGVMLAPDPDAPPAEADAHRARAAAHDQAAAESFARSDTDGFVTQWSHGVMGQLERVKADLAANGNKAEFPALFDLDGNLVPAKRVSGQYGTSWGILPNDDPNGSFTGWFNPSQAENEKRRHANNAKKGYYEGTVRAPADAKLGGGGTGLAGALSVHPVVYRTDGGFSRDVDVVDNGHKDPQ